LWQNISTYFSCLLFFFCGIYWCLMLNGKEGVSHCFPQKCGSALCVTTAHIIISFHIYQLKLFRSLALL